MNEIQIFNNSEFGEIRTLMIDNEPYFVGKDVATVLGYVDTFGALKKHVDDEDKQNCQNDSFESNRGLTIINESGLYSLILSSKLPTAKKFKRWVTSEILPAIRKTGSYTVKSEQTAEDKSRRLALQEMNARTRQANMLIKLADIDTVSKEYKNILISKATEILTGENLLPLPKSEQKTYSATEVGQLFGVSAQTIGRIATKHNLKTDEYGSWYHDKSPYSSKEVDTFRYNDKAVERFREIISQ